MSLEIVRKAAIDFFNKLIESGPLLEIVYSNRLDDVKNIKEGTESLNDVIMKLLAAQTIEEIQLIVDMGSGND
jgi:hypothetical protein